MKKRNSPLATLLFLIAMAAVAAAFVTLAASLAGCGADDSALSSTSAPRLDPPATRACANPPHYLDVTAFRTSCDRCHASTLPPARREGAPVDVNFDTYDDAVAAARASYSEVESNGMPPDQPLSTSDRATLIEWLRCGTPR
jgi:hypothetical protein